MRSGVYIDCSSTIVKLQIEHRDTDANGITHFSRYASMAETSLFEVLEQKDIGLSLLEQQFGLDLRIHELHMRYIAPSYFRDWLLVGCIINQVGVAHFRANVTIERIKGETEFEVLASGNLSIAVVSHETGRPTAIPEYIKQRLRGEDA